MFLVVAVLEGQPISKAGGFSPPLPKSDLRWPPKRLSDALTTVSFFCPAGRLQVRVPRRDEPGGDRGASEEGHRHRGRSQEGVPEEHAVDAGRKEGAANLLRAMNRASDGV